MPTPLPAAPTTTPGPLAGAPASEVDPFVGRLFMPIALIVGLVLAGFLLAKLRGRSAQGALAGGQQGLEPELYSAFADPVAPFLEPVPPADEAAEDAWANVRTIAVHVEEIEPREE